MLWLVAMGALLACCFTAATSADPASATASHVDYAKDIRPILAARCYECHGPEKHKGGFRADSKSQALAATDSGDVPIVPGDTLETLYPKAFSAASRLLDRTLGAFESGDVIRKPNPESEKTYYTYPTKSQIRAYRRLVGH